MNKGASHKKEGWPRISQAREPSERTESGWKRARFLLAPELTEAYLTVRKVVAVSIGLALGIVFAIKSLLDP